MGVLTVQDVRQLAASGDGPRVSLYFPTPPGGPEIGANNPARLKNLLRQAERRLQEMGKAAAEVEELLAPAYELAAEPDYWRGQAAGFAGFLSAAGLEPYRLPVEPPERVVVSERFFLKPLLPLLIGDGRFFVLALSQKQVRLLEGSMTRIRELDLHSIPRRLQDAVGYDWQEGSLQFHTVGAARGPAHGGAVFHGQGAGNDDQKAEVEKFLRAVDKGLLELLRDKQAPLVLAAAEPIQSMYREISKHPNLVTPGIVGSPDQTSPEDLHAAAWKLVEPGFRAERRAARDRYAELAGTGRATDRLRDILPATFDGRVDTLFVAADLERWGRYDPASRAVRLVPEPGPGDHDLLDLAAVEALHRGGTVYAVPDERLPGDPTTGIAAIYRY